MNHCIRNKTLVRIGFTLVELLIAMTITLLLMVALAKSFAVIGQSIKDGRSKVTLSSKLRGISFRLRTDLRSSTVATTPPIKSDSGQGYFVYYEGPLTESTFGLYGAEPTQTTIEGVVVRPGDANYNLPDNSPTYRRHSRLGDIDDYIAFTAEAPGDDWFTGKVPAYLVDDSAADPMEPRVIRSKYAEIIIWASPKWSVDPTTNLLQMAANPTAMPLYLDDNNDYIPDGVVLHQRVLLIRPDLNARRVIPSAPTFAGEVLRPQNGDINPYVVPAALQRLYPIGTTNNTTGSPPTPMFPNYAVGTPATASDNSLMLTSNWLVGMTPLHHFFDLSLRRVINPSTGDPTGYVAVNSLQDLVQPHNRFAHVRYPGRYFGRGDFSSNASTSDDATSMPLLALGWNDTILNWQGTTDPRSEVPLGSAPSWFPTSHPSPLTLNNAGTTTTRSGLFNGWLLPHFELGDANPAGAAGSSHWKRGYLATEDRRWDRTGEDVIGANILAFDIRAFDRTAPVFLTSGPDGDPGQSGVDDDGVGGADTTFVFGTQPSSELGSIGSDDQLVNLSDYGVYDVMDQPTLDPNNTGSFGVDNQSFGSQGAFVDLLYPYLAGSPLRERTNQARTVRTFAPAVLIPTTPFTSPPATASPNAQNNYGAFMGSDFSAFQIDPLVLSPLKRSGKLVHFGTGGNICYLQPTYDTWTDGYETDGFDQTHSLTGAVTGAPAPQLVGTTWVLNNVAGLTRTPRLPSPGTPNAVQIDTGRMMPTEPETSPPFPAELPAVSISVRIGDPVTNGMTEFTVIEHMQ